MSEKSQEWFCYMVRCRDGSLYVGIANELVEREKEHNWGVGATFTAKRRPVKLVWSEKRKSQSDARKREIEIKGWSRKKKLDLINRFEAVQMAKREPFGPLRVPQGEGE